MAKYLVNGDKRELDVWDLENLIDDFYDENGYDYFDELLNEEMPYGILVCGETFYPADILKKLSPTTYRCSYVDFKSFQVQELIRELENTGEVSVGDNLIEVVEDPEEDEYCCTFEFLNCSKDDSDIDIEDAMLNYVEQETGCYVVDYEKSIDRDSETITFSDIEYK